MATAEIRDCLRSDLNEARQVNREKALLSKRKALQDISLPEIGREVTQEEVATVASKIKHKSAVNLDDLAILKVAFIQTQDNMTAFLKVPGALNALVRELSRAKPKYQLAAAECLCNLALGNTWTCRQVAKAAAPYFIALLSGCNYNAITVSVWALGNLAGSDDKTWQILHGQGFLRILIKLISECEVVSATQRAENYLLALVQVLRMGAQLLTVEELRLIAKTLENMSDSNITRTKGYRVSEYLLSTTEAAEEELISSKAVVKCLYFLSGAEINEATLAPFTSGLRTIANITAECSGAGCSQVFEHWALLRQVIDKVFTSKYPHLVRELGWLMANLVNHPQSQPSLSNYLEDFQAFESQFTSFPHN